MADLPPVWHITTDGTPATARPEEGFVHASFPHQIAGSLAKHFVGVDRIVLLRLDAAALGDTLVVEPSRGGQDFPHVYGPIEAAHVVERVEAARGADGTFDLSGVPGA